MSMLDRIVLCALTLVLLLTVGSRAATSTVDSVNGVDVETCVAFDDSQSGPPCRTLNFVFSTVLTQSSQANTSKNLTVKMRPGIHTVTPVSLELIDFILIGEVNGDNLTDLPIIAAESNRVDTVYFGLYSIEAHVLPSTNASLITCLNCRVKVSNISFQNASFAVAPKDHTFQGGSVFAFVHSIVSMEDVIFQYLNVRPLSSSEESEQMEGEGSQKNIMATTLNENLGPGGGAIYSLNSYLHFYRAKFLFCQTTLGGGGAIASRALSSWAYSDRGWMGPSQGSTLQPSLNITGGEFTHCVVTVSLHDAGLYSTDVLYGGGAISFAYIIAAPLASFEAEDRLIFPQDYYNDPLFTTDVFIRFSTFLHCTSSQTRGGRAIMLSGGAISSLYYQALPTMGNLTPSESTAAWATPCVGVCSSYPRTTLVDDTICHEITANVGDFPLSHAIVAGGVVSAARVTSLKTFALAFTPGGATYDEQGVNITDLLPPVHITIHKMDAAHVQNNFFGKDIVFVGGVLSSLVLGVPCQQGAEECDRRGFRSDSTSLSFNVVSCRISNVTASVEVSNLKSSTISGLAIGSLGIGVSFVEFRGGGYDEQQEGVSRRRLSNWDERQRDSVRKRKARSRRSLKQGAVDDDDDQNPFNDDDHAEPGQFFTPVFVNGTVPIKVELNVVDVLFSNPILSEQTQDFRTFYVNAAYGGNIGLLLFSTSDLGDNLFSNAMPLFKPVLTVKWCNFVSSGFRASGGGGGAIALAGSPTVVPIGTEFIVEDSGFFGCSVDLNGNIGGGSILLSFPCNRIYDTRVIFRSNYFEDSVANIGSQISSLEREVQLSEDQTVGGGVIAIALGRYSKKLSAQHDTEGSHTSELSTVSVEISNNLGSTCESTIFGEPSTSRLAKAEASSTFYTGGGGGILVSLRSSEGKSILVNITDNTFTEMLASIGPTEGGGGILYVEAILFPLILQSINDSITLAELLALPPTVYIALEHNRFVNGTAEVPGTGGGGIACMLLEVSHWPVTVAVRHNSFIQGEAGVALGGGGAVCIHSIYSNLLRPYFFFERNSFFQNVVYTSYIGGGGAMAIVLLGSYGGPILVHVGHSNFAEDKSFAAFGGGGAIFSFLGPNSMIQGFSGSLNSLLNSILTPSSGDLPTTPATRRVLRRLLHVAKERNVDTEEEEGQEIEADDDLAVEIGPKPVILQQEGASTITIDTCFFTQEFGGVILGSGGGGAVMVMQALPHVVARQVRGKVVEGLEPFFGRIVNSRFESCTGGFHDGANGGAISLPTAFGDWTFDRTTFINNSGDSGGAIFVSSISRVNDSTGPCLWELGLQETELSRTSSSQEYSKKYSRASPQSKKTSSASSPYFHFERKQSFDRSSSDNNGAIIWPISGTISDYVVHCQGPLTLIQLKDCTFLGNIAAAIGGGVFAAVPQENWATQVAEETDGEAAEEIEEQLEEEGEGEEGEGEGEGCLPLRRTKQIVAILSMSGNYFSDNEASEASQLFVSMEVHLALHPGSPETAASGPGIAKEKDDYTNNVAAEDGFDGAPTAQQQLAASSIALCDAAVRSCGASVFMFDNSPFSIITSGETVTGLFPSLEQNSSHSSAFANCSVPVCVLCPVGSELVARTDKTGIMSIGCSPCETGSYLLQGSTNYDPLACQACIADSMGSASSATAGDIWTAMRGSECREGGSQLTIIYGYWALLPSVPRVPGLNLSARLETSRGLQQHPSGRSSYDKVSILQGVADWLFPNILSKSDGGEAEVFSTESSGTTGEGFIDNSDSFSDLISSVASIDPSVTIIWCPPGVCCSSASCSVSDPCSPHRGGRLCSKCRKGYVHGVTGTWCTEDTVCFTETLVFYTVVLALFVSLEVLLCQAILWAVSSKEKESTSDIIVFIRIVVDFYQVAVILLASADWSALQISPYSASLLPSFEGGSAPVPFGMGVFISAFLSLASLTFGILRIPWEGLCVAPFSTSPLGNLFMLFIPPVLLIGGPLLLWIIAVFRQRKGEEPVKRQFVRSASGISLMTLFGAREASSVRAISKSSPHLTERLLPLPERIAERTADRFGRSGERASQEEDEEHSDVASDRLDETCYDESPAKTAETSDIAATGLHTSASAFKLESGESGLLRQRQSQFGEDVVPQSPLTQESHPYGAQHSDTGRTWRSITDNTYSRLAKSRAGNTLVPQEDTVAKHARALFLRCALLGVLLSFMPVMSFSTSILSCISLRDGVYSLIDPDLPCFGLADSSSPKPPAGEVYAMMTLQIVSVLVLLAIVLPFPAVLYALSRRLSLDIRRKRDRGALSSKLTPRPKSMPISRQAKRMGDDAVFETVHGVGRFLSDARAASSKALEHANAPAPTSPRSFGYEPAWKLSSDLSVNRDVISAHSWDRKEELTQEQLRLPLDKAIERTSNERNRQDETEEYNPDLNEGTSDELPPKQSMSAELVEKEEDVQYTLQQRPALVPTTQSRQPTTESARKVTEGRRRASLLALGSSELLFGRNPLLDVLNMLTRHGHRWYEPSLLYRNAFLLFLSMMDGSGSHFMRSLLTAIVLTASLLVTLSARPRKSVLLNATECVFIFINLNVVILNMRTSILIDVGVPFYLPVVNSTCAAGFDPHIYQCSLASLVLHFLPILFLVGTAVLSTKAAKTRLRQLRNRWRRTAHT